MSKRRKKSVKMLNTPSKVGFNPAIKTKARLNSKVSAKSKNANSESSSNTKKMINASPQIRLCYIKLRKIPTNIAFNNKLPTVSKNGNNKEIEMKNSVLLTNKSEINANVVKKVYNTRGNKGCENNIAGYKKIQDNNIRKFSKSNILNQMKNVTVDKLNKEKSAFDVTCPKKIENINLKHATVKKTSRKSRINTSSHENTKKFVHKLQRTPLKNKTCDILNAQATPFINKRCVVKLQRISTTKKAENDFADSTSYKKRICFVKLQRIPFSIKNIENKKNEGCVPIFVDNIARNNFCKSKPFRKLTENKETANVTNSKLDNNYKEETQEIFSNSDKIETSKTIITSNEENQLQAKKTLIKPEKLTSIKHVNKLSLRRPSVIRHNNKTVLDVTHFESQHNSMLCFMPTRNSSVLELDMKENEFVENLKEGSEKNISKDKTSKNLANKSEEIENLLNSLDDDDDEIPLNSLENKNENDGIIIDINQNNLQIQNEISATNIKKNKFFHCKKVDTAEYILKERAEQKTKHPTSRVRKKQRFHAKRNTILQRSNIYEFLSQSQSDSANTDPTADIIKKLINQGKVRLATNCKGKGKPKFKRIKPLTRQMKKKIKQTADKKLEEMKQNTKKVTFTEENKYEACGQDHHFEDHIDNDEIFSDGGNDMEIQRQCIVSNISEYQNHKNLTNEDGTFSRLAKTVLINQTERSGAQTKNASELLEMVKKYFSTPKSKKINSSQAALEPDLSPINMLPRGPQNNASPWRVNPDAYLPKTFSFTRSSGNLPSFSSDFIPFTPRKENPRVPHQTPVISKKSETTNRRNLTPHHVKNTQTITSNLIDPTAISSFSSNDSNAENMPPRNTSENHNENDNIFNLKQFPNPRRALNNRSPLKAINILEVVNLPPFKHVSKAINSKEISREQIPMFGFEENLGDTSIQNHSVATANAMKQTDASIKADINSPREDLFGFEDFLSETEFSSQKNNGSNNNDMVKGDQNQTIHDKLQDLRKLKPDENELQTNLNKKNTRYPIKTIRLFENEASKEDDGMRQRGIREMLHSTMLHTQTSKNKQAVGNSNRSKLGTDSGLIELFKDNEPETSFNKTDAHRTYIRPYKRKRHLKENKYVMILDSDESGEEDNSHEEQNLQPNQESSCSISEKAPNKKRNCKEPRENTELIEIAEFNNMVKEVESYELIVEKSI